MIRVGQVTTQDWPFAPVHQLPDSVGTTQQATVEVHAHHHDVLDPTFLEKRQQFSSVVRHGIGGGNLDALDLMCPRMG